MNTKTNSKPERIVNSTPDDMAEIFRLYRMATDYQKTKDSACWPEFEAALVAEEIAEGWQWKIVEDNRIACIWAVTFSDPLIWEEKNEDCAMYIHRLAVNPDFRGRNLGVEMLAWAKSYAEENAIKFIRLDTVGENHGLIRYYRRLGFNCLGLTSLKDTSGLPSHYHNKPVCRFEIALTESQPTLI
jgi:ribosomal protein S18 acetylase RimI-like enzyme